MSWRALATTRRTRGTLVLISVVVMSCGGSDEFSTSDTAEWLRAAGRFDETPAEIACIESAMHDLLSDEELDEWLSRDPDTITVEEIQSLPHAIEVADRCR